MRVDADAENAAMSLIQRQHFKGVAIVAELLNSVSAGTAAKNVGVT